MKGSLSRDLSAKKIYEEEEVYPEYGEGSEYGRKQREEVSYLSIGIEYLYWSTLLVCYVYICI